MADNPPQGFPESFAHLREFAFHAAERAWTGLGHFFVAQSILALAWAALLQASAFPGRSAVLVAISLGGILMGFQWALLGTRMWQYHLQYMEQLSKIWKALSVQQHGDGATAWTEIDAEIRRYWREGSELNRLKVLSANQFILFFAPLILSGIHLIMLFVIVWTLGGVWEYVAIACTTAVLIGFAAVWVIARPILKSPEF